MSEETTTGVHRLYERMKMEHFCAKISMILLLNPSLIISMVVKSSVDA